MNAGSWIFRDQEQIIGRASCGRFEVERSGVGVPRQLLPLGQQPRQCGRAPSDSLEKLEGAWAGVSGFGCAIVTALTAGSARRKVVAAAA